ncbi:hypothetical protein CTI12_AA037740 [Artemisia annua]|uniref:Uncharacterized protein n=1 Tax=Artemisia annua TaxID=35608 RepID=A0A2U1QEU2_ARTAN|nr:hypothetical protein CTI12_AA037740 [Artemisia annua]
MLTQQQRTRTQQQRSKRQTKVIFEPYGKPIPCPFKVRSAPRKVAGVYEPRHSRIDTVHMRKRRIATTRVCNARWRYVENKF